MVYKLISIIYLLICLFSSEEAAKEAREIEKARGDRISENLQQRLEVSETTLKSLQERSIAVESEAKDIQSKLTIQINGLQTELHMFQVRIYIVSIIRFIYSLLL